MKNLMLFLIFGLLINSCINEQETKTFITVINDKWILVKKGTDEEIFKDSTVLEFETSPNFLDETVYVDGLSFYSINGELQHYVRRRIDENFDEVIFPIILDFGDSRRMSFESIDTSLIIFKNENNLFHFERLQSPLLEEFEIGRNISDSVREVRSRIVPYIVIECYDIGLAGSLRKACRVLLSVDEIPAEIQINKVFTKIYKERGLVYNEFTIFFYLPGMNMNHSAYYVGEIKRNYTDFKLQVNNASLVGTKWADE